ncbi:NADH-quinone oxidoreductase subunit NuoK [Epilithonimonas hominis]|uniref:NADH-quinone oxidoreductase subunit K n=1 Tax=Epilithonimonas hominis TaxID=420404 RepID=A0A1H6HLK8_9FLAO|nr:NADH-quinone oxidoreductase subunit NuoK [Epilithonimonas hominis]ROI14057.1 NADH-quinone oxidoreductase subunit NuoK [Epilithonimonas hominis]SEH36611.1 NADH-quinone oxidoreductase subunit K [Epilithonimonas hominis]
MNTFIQQVPLEYFIILSTILFCLGVLGVLVRKNAIVILGCVELMLNSVNLLLAAFSAYKGDGHGQLLVFFIMVVAAAEVAVGLAIIAMMYRNTKSVDVSIFNKLRG